MSSYDYGILRSDIVEELRKICGNAYLPDFMRPIISIRLYYCEITPVLDFMKNVDRIS